MRIVSGKYRGRTIKAPGNLPTRPTTDMAKEALFNILNNHVYFDQIKVLDLFCGTGNISFEFYSRGSHRVVSVDDHYACINFVKKTSEELQAKGVIEAIKSDAIKFIKRSREKYDVIFADPPYAFEKYDDLIQSIFENDILEENGLVVVEHDSKHDFENSPFYFNHRKYGTVNFSFFSAKPSQDS